MRVIVPRRIVVAAALVLVVIVAVSVTMLLTRQSGDASATVGAADATTTSDATTTTVVPTTTAIASEYQSSVSTVTAEQLGATWRPGCPVPVEQLRAIDLTYWGDDGRSHLGRLIVGVDQVDRVVLIFRDMYAARFPIHKVVPIDAYGGDDQASMRDNNTSGFNCRVVAGTSKWSQHAYGRAIDVNPLVNPYVRGSRVDPPEGAPYADRTRTDGGMIHAGGAAVRAFVAQGWGWGGSWSGGQDYQHFSASGG